MYQQTLYKVIDHIKPQAIKRLNKSKSGNMVTIKSMMLL